MLTKEFPILEFDTDRNPFIKPTNTIKPIDITDKCVLCFFSDAIEKLLAEYPHKIVKYLKSECFKFPVYELDYKGEKIVLIQAGGWRAFSRRAN